MLRDLFSLFPAYAGVILVESNPQVIIGPFPRIRGGDPHIVHLLNFIVHFSPHTRG